MLGTVVNTAAIIAGSLIGLMFRGGIPEKTNRTIMQAIGLSVILIGLTGGLKTQELLLLIISLAVGSLVGELLRVEDRLETMGNRLGGLFRQGGDGFTHGFVTASLVYCVGAMAIVGSLESGLAGNHQTLFAKSVLDGVTAIIFASTLGVGVLFSALSVLLYQGAITLGASFVKQFMTPPMINEMSAVGGVLIMAIGINILEIQKLRIGNMLPAIFLPPVYFVFRQWLFPG